MYPKVLLLGMMLVLGASTTNFGGEATKSPGSIGRLHLTFTEHSPLNTLDEVCRRMDIDLQSRSRSPSVVESARRGYDLANESFDVFVPPTYKPNVPHGLFVWTGVTEVPPTWLRVFGRHKLIFISANPVNGRIGFIRWRLPLDAVHNMKNLYKIDEDRIYVSGFSAGGGVATYMVCGFPDVFRGGCFLMGGLFYTTHKNENGRYEPTLERLSPQWKGPLDQIKRDMRLVLMRAHGDTIYSPQEDRAQYEGLWLDGFERVDYIVVPGGGHNPPNASWFEKGIIALDQSKPKTPPTTGPTTQPHPLPGQIAQAQRILATAQYYLGRKPAKGIDQRVEGGFRKSSQDSARKYLQQVLDEYPTTPAAAKARELSQRIDQRIAEQHPQ